MTFETHQAYPELVLHLKRKEETTRQFQGAEVQEILGKADKEMAPGTRIYVQGIRVHNPLRVGERARAVPGRRGRVRWATQTTPLTSFEILLRYGGKPDVTFPRSRHAR